MRHHRPQRKSRPVCGPAPTSNRDAERGAAGGPAGVLGVGAGFLVGVLLMDLGSDLQQEQLAASTAGRPQCVSVTGPEGYELEVGATVFVPLLLEVIGGILYYHSGMGGRTTHRTKKAIVVYRENQKIA